MMVGITVFKGSPSKKIQQSSTTKDIKPDEVLIRITHSGVCGTDVHYKGADQVLGHEGVGVVEEIGKDVKLFKKGDRAGWGYEYGSCMHCAQCLRGAETFCPERRFYGETDFDQGSFASHAIWSEAYLFHVPEQISSAAAAPLMCGGATVFNALSLHGVKSTDRVGIIGIGGLGHLAIQFAAAMSCEVVVFSGSDRKKDEAKKLGATEFHAMKGVDSLEGKVKPLDHLLVTTSVLPDFDLYVPIMNPEAAIYPISVSMDKVAIPAQAFVQRGIRVLGCLVAARAIHKKMLDFASRKGIKPWVEEFEMSVKGIEEAFEKLESGKMRYRGVLVAAQH